MKISRSNDRVQHGNSETCAVNEYPIDTKQLNCSVINLTGRYPETGQAVNEQCDEMAFVQQGAGSITINGESVSLNEGDMVLVERGDQFFWQGQMTLFVACAPAWFPEQHVHIES